MDGRDFEELVLFDDYMTEEEIRRREEEVWEKYGRFFR